MDLDCITHPLRLARGSHQSGSGKGCAMNAISYINGDAQITDFQATSARPLASFVQLCNDLLAGPDGYLSPEDGSGARLRLVDGSNRRHRSAIWHVSISPNRCSFRRRVRK